MQDASLSFVMRRSSGLFISVTVECYRFVLYTGQQELSYRKHIARQLCTQYVEGIYRPKYYSDLEIQVKGHSRSLSTEPLDKSYKT